VPEGLLLVVVLEGVVAAEEDKQEDAKGPHVGPVVVAGHRLAEDLRGGVLERPAGLHDLLARSDDGGEAKVGEEDVAGDAIVAVGEEDVLGLDVAVDDAPGVEVVKGLEEVAGHDEADSLGELALLDQPEQLPTLGELEDQLPLGGRLEGLLESENGVVVESGVDGDLLPELRLVGGVLGLGDPLDGESHPVGPPGGQENPAEVAGAELAVNLVGVVEALGGLRGLGGGGLGCVHLLLVLLLDDLLDRVEAGEDTGGHATLAADKSGLGGGRGGRGRGGGGCGGRGGTEEGVLEGETTK